MIHVNHALRRATILAAGQFDTAVIRAHLDRCLQTLIELSGRRREFGEINSCISPPLNSWGLLRSGIRLAKGTWRNDSGEPWTRDRVPSDSRYALFAPLPRKFCKFPVQTHAITDRKLENIPLNYEPVTHLWHISGVRTKQEHFCNKKLVLFRNSFKQIKNKNNISTERVLDEFGLCSVLLIGGCWVGSAAL